MQTYSGRKFWPLDPRPEDVSIEDIAHALSLVCRFGGHCLRFYSVAEHSILVSQHCGEADALAGLLHDGSEAYLLDMVRPVKRFMADYRAAEERLQRVVFEAFGLDPVTPPAVKRADMALLVAERAQVMRPTDDVWSIDAEPLDVLIDCCPPYAAKTLFLDRFHQLTRVRG